MGAGFVQRSRSPLSIDAYKAIEGVYIIDKGGPQFVKGQGTGAVAVIGEFADMKYAVAIDASGNVTTYPKPVQIFGSDDLLAKLGDFDALLGDIGDAGGNGYLDIDGCAYTELIAVPVNLCSSRGIRVWRKLPTNTSATNPTPVVPISAGTVAAGREFKSGVNRVRLGTRVLFQSREAYAKGTDGSVTAVAGAATPATVTSAVGPFDFRALGATQLSIQFNAGGAQAFNITASAATKAGAAAAFPWTGNFTFKVNGGPVQTVTGAGTASAADLAVLINATAFDCTAVVNGANVDLVSDRKGTGATVEIVSITDTIGASGFTAGTATGAGTVANDALVTATELAAIIDGPLTDGTATAVGGALVLTSTTTGVAGTGTVLAASTADTVMGGEFATNVVKTGAAAGAGGGTSLAFTAAGGDFVTKNVAEGDALVLGVIDAAGAQGANAGTYRVKSRDSATQLTVEKQDGTSFNWTTGATLAWRLHLWDVADSGKDHQFSEAGGYIVPARPLDATVVAGTVIDPTIIPPALTASSADQLSGLTAAIHPSGDLTYTAAVQAPNVTGSGLDTLYTRRRSTPCWARTSRRPESTWRSPAARRR